MQDIVQLEDNSSRERMREINLYRLNLVPSFPSDLYFCL